MANFRSWKTYMLRLIDRLAVMHGMQAPFLDAGCGSGDVSLHLANRGWAGNAVDFSDEAVLEAVQRLRDHRIVSVVRGNLLALELSPAKTVLLMDVIEHVRDDETLLRRLSDLVLPGGHLVVTVPVNPTEWRWDDEFYGHYRRYVREDFTAMIERSGLQVLSVWDCSFPLFWGMRRVYTAILRERDGPVRTLDDRTKCSSQRSAWNFSPVSAWIDGLIMATRLYYVQYPFRHGRWGCEILLVAGKPGGEENPVERHGETMSDSMRFSGESGIDSTADETVAPEFYANGVASHSLGLPAGAQRTPATPGHGRPDEFDPNGVASVAGTAPGSGVVLVTQPRWATL